MRKVLNSVSRGKNVGEEVVLLGYTKNASKDTSRLRPPAYLKWHSQPTCDEKATQFPSRMDLKPSVIDHARFHSLVRWAAGHFYQQGTANGFPRWFVAVQVRSLLLPGVASKIILSKIMTQYQAIGLSCSTQRGSSPSLGLDCTARPGPTHPQSRERPCGACRAARLLRLGPIHAHHHHISFPQITRPSPHLPLASARAVVTGLTDHIRAHN